MAAPGRSRNPGLTPGSSETAGGYEVVGPGSIKAITSSPATVRNAKIEAVCPADFEGNPADFFFFLDFSTVQLSNSSSSRRACAEAIRASWRCADEQYCWSVKDRRKPI